jgi:hypothetical protein
MIFHPNTVKKLARGFTSVAMVFLIGFLLLLITALLCTPAKAAGVIPQASSQSAGGPYALGASTFVQFIPSNRVHYFGTGEFAVCMCDDSEPAEMYAAKKCTSRATGKNAWQALRVYNPVGYRLTAIQILRTYNDLELVLYWDPTSETLKAAAEHGK